MVSNGALTSPRHVCSPIGAASYSTPGSHTVWSMAYIFPHDSSHKSVWDSHPITDARNNLTVCDLYHHTYPECLELKERWLRISGMRGSMDSFPCMAHVYRKELCAIYDSPAQVFSFQAKKLVSAPYVCISAFFPHPSPQPTHSPPPRPPSPSARRCCAPRVLIR